MALTKIPANLLDKSAHVDFADNEKLRIGTGNDLEIYHDASNSYIKDTGNGALEIWGSNINIRGTDGGYLGRFTSESWAGLFHNNVEKLRTSSSGATVTGTLTVTGDLDITGNVNSASVTDLDVEDKTITLGVGQTEAQSGGSGIVIDGSSASLLWDETNTSWDFNEAVEIASGKQLRVDTVNNVGNSANIIYRSSTKTIVGNNASALVVLDGGNVGVGTTSPQTNFHVESPSSDGSGLRISRASNSAYMQLFPAYSSVPTIQGKGAGGLHLGYNSATAGIRINTSNNVGIGTSSPGHRLHISGASNDDARVRVHNSASGQASLDLDNSEGYFRTFTDAGEYRIYDQTDGVYRLLIDTNGRVGIGTSSPGSYNSNADNLIVRDSGNVGITLSSGATSDCFVAFANGEDNGIHGLIQYDHNTDAMHFRTNDVDSRLVINSSGNVGIGEASPDSLLHIKGAAPVITLESNTNSSSRTFDFATERVEGGDLSLRMSSSQGGTPNTTVTYWKDNGKVGMGTTDPKSHLHVHASSGDGELLITGDNNPLRGGKIIGHNGGLTFRINTGTNEQYQERARINTDGRFGIGVAPSAGLGSGPGLQISGGNDNYQPTNFNEQSQISINTVNSEGRYASIRFSHNGNTEGFYGLVRATSTSDITDWVWQMYNGSNNNYEEQFRISEQGYPQFPQMGAGSGENAVQWWSGGGRGGGMLIYVSSSQQYKKDITDCTIDSSKIYNLQAKSFKWNEKSVHEDKEDWGMIAEEVIEHIPELGVYRDGKVDSLQYEKLSVLLLEEIKKLNERIKVLEG